MIIIMMVIMMMMMIMILTHISFTICHIMPKGFISTKLFSSHNYEKYTIIILILLDKETEVGYITCPRTLSW